MHTRIVFSEKKRLTAWRFEPCSILDVSHIEDLLVAWDCCSIKSTREIIAHAYRSGSLRSL
jgi:hypothetical protein